MTKIKRLAPKLCPDCNMGGTLFIAADRTLTCRMCGYKERKAKAKTTQSAHDPRDKWKVTYGTPNTSEVERWAETKYTTGLDYTRQKKYDDALSSFEQAVDMQRDFVDAHIWIARLSLDPKKKNYHYGEVIARMPMNIEAQRELMVIKGDMTREEADRALDMSQERDIRDANTAVEAKMIEIVCSSCGGTLEASSHQGHVTCIYCGHDEPIKQDRGVAMQSLSSAMILDRGQGATWRVGQYLLHCDNCGSERIITSKNMTSECPFCGSNHVIRADALQSFRQPDGIVPFGVKRKAARLAVDDALDSFSEKIKGIFVNNRVEKIQMSAVYLPFWIFDVSAQINVTKVENTSTTRTTSLTQLQNKTRRDTYHDGLNNVPYCGVESPSHRLTDRLDKFDLESAKDYDPKLLAGYTAEIYSIDYQKASLNVRDEVGERFRFRHGHNPNGNPQVTVSYLIQQMSFRLMMLPVWVATITENDGDVRLGLVHGQTGKAFLGNAISQK
ncbi:MAG: hypothetical protein WBC91_24215 [Phototrophicaceae bacterium]